jgi:hypothetical protein
MAYRGLKGSVEWAEPEYKKVLYENVAGLDPEHPETLDRWTPNDPYYSSQWHYNNTGQQGGTVDCDIDLPEAWDLEKGHQDVIVAVIDGGIQTNHPDLNNNIWSGVGYNFVNGSTTINPEDHGTHVAGTIAAENNNSTGVCVQIEMARVYCSTACTISVNGMVGANISKFASEEQKLKFLPELLHGEGIASFAFTEASTGSDPNALRTTCVREGDEWVINGEKRFISNATMPGLMTIFCKDVEMGGKCTNIILPKGIKGYSTPRIYDKMGMHGLEVSDVILDQVRVP